MNHLAHSCRVAFLALGVAGATGAFPGAQSSVKGPVSSLKTPENLPFPPLSAATPLDTNLLTNPSFENDLTAWNVVAANVAVQTYGSAGVPDTSVSTHIGGGGKLVRDNGANAILEQIVQVKLPSRQTVLRAGGYFGGGLTDGARMVVRFLDGAGGEISRHNLAPVMRQTRNFETALMLREELLDIPGGTKSIAARIEFLYVCCSAADGAADALYLELTEDSLVPDPLPTGQNLLTNAGFEDGWAPGSPLSLNELGGWEGVSGGSVVVKPYSDTDPYVPSSLVSCVIAGGPPSPFCMPGGAGNLLVDEGANGVLRQRIDVRGNAAQFGSPGLALRVSAFLGGFLATPDEARIEVRFLDASLTTIAPLSPVGPVTTSERNEETVLLLREREYPVPVNTAYIEVDAAMTYGCCGDAFGMIDNVDARLTEPSAPQPTVLNQNLVENGSFESGVLLGSPLVLPDPNTWVGTNINTAYVDFYGSSANVPSTTFAAANGLGGQVLRHLGGAVLEKSFDLATDQELVDTGRLRIYLEAWLGGAGVAVDSAEVRLQFLNVFGVPTGLLQTLPPVTAAERGNVTAMLQRTSDFPIPFGARSMRLQVQFNEGCCGGSFALADGIQLVVYDVLMGGPTLLPGSGDSLELLTGINAQPIGGPGHDFEFAESLDVLNVEVLSPDGSWDLTPLILAAGFFPTGGPVPDLPPGTPAGVHINLATATILADGFNCASFGCPTVLPGGTNYSFLIPPGLEGQSFFLQAFAFPVSGSPTPMNGVAAATSAHQIQID